MRLVAITVAALALAGCSSQQAVTGASVSGTPYGAPPEPMAGRWQFAGAGSSQCAMTFGGTPDSGEGTIAPEGGCPGSFYTSRKWTFENGSLVIRDHTGKPLGELAPAAPGRFDGKSVSGMQLTLSR